jgi:hypothetical protein
METGSHTGTDSQDRGIPLRRQQTDLRALLSAGLT